MGWSFDLGWGLKFRVFIIGLYMFIIRVMFWVDEM